MTLGQLSLGLAATARWWAGAPVELDREQARELARRELAHPSYDADPPLLQRIVEWIIARIDELIGRTAGALDGWVGIAVLVALLVLVAAIVALRIGPLARRATREAALFPTGRRSAAEYRGRAEAAAARGDWSIAVVERYRAVVAGFEERGLLDPRPGRTADEAAAEAGAALPVLAADLTAGSGLFDRVRYGGRAATAADDARMRRLDDDARTARPGRAEGVSSASAPAVPR